MASLVVLNTIVGCRTVTDEDTGQQYQEMDPENPGVKIVDKVADVAKPVIETALPFLPAPFNLIAELALLGIVGWQKVKQIRIAKGSRAARTVISKYVKGTENWDAAKIELLAAENEGLIKATMPNKI